MSAYHLFALVYLVLLSLASTLLTVCDKRNAVKGRRRVPEKTLLLFAAAGGAGAMYGMMRAVRHKTLHRSFMLGIPAIMILQIAILLGIYNILYSRGLL